MASLVWLGGLYPHQLKVPDYNGADAWLGLLTSIRGTGLKAVIAKGNKIDEVEAKT